MGNVIHNSPGEHVWVPIPGIEKFPQRVCECGAFWAPGGTRSGTNTITLSPSGAAEVIRFSTTATPVVGDFGLTNNGLFGRPTFAVGTAGTASTVLTVHGAGEPPVTKYVGWYPNPNATTIASYGTNTAITTESTGTASSLTTNGWGISYTTAAVINTDGGWTGTATFQDFRGEFAGSYLCTIRTGGDITNVRYFVGFFSGDPMGSATPAVHGAGFRYDTGTDGTAFWRTWTNNGGGTPQVTTTGSGIAANNTYQLAIRWTASSYAFFISASGVATHSTTIPTSTQGMGPIAGLRTLTATAKTCVIGGITGTVGAVGQ